MANNEYVNKVIFGNQTLMDISDTTAEQGDVIQGQTFYTKSGAPAVGTLGDATTTAHGLMSAADKAKLDALSEINIQEIEISIATTDWSNSAPYTYTWTNSAITASCYISILFKTDPRGVLDGDLNYEKVTGGIQFTATALPTGTLQVVIQIIDSGISFVVDPEAIGESVSTWLDENMSGGETIVVDSSLSVAGAAADAKQVGQIQNELSNRPSMINTTEDADLDITDESGNVILRLQNGNIKTKYFDSTDPFQVPEYYFDSGYLPNKCARLNEIARACTSQMDTFTFCTDQHWHLNAGKSPALLKYIKEHTNIDKFFFGGDFCDFITGEAQPFNGFRLYNEALNLPLYTTMGNHDYMSSAGTEGRLYYTFNSVGRDRIGNLKRNYFYIDNPQSEIRYIFLNGFKPGNNTWDWGLEQAQLDWLTNTALNLNTGWGAIIITHMILGINLDNQTLYKPTMATNLLSALDSYSGNGEIIAIICGHTHFDYVDYSNGGIPILITTSDKYSPWISSNVDKEPWLSDRIQGTITEQAIDMYVVDRERKLMTRVRVGCPIHYGFDPTSWTEYEEKTISYSRT